MTKPMTVRQLHDKLLDLIEQGKGSAPVLIETSTYNPPKPRTLRGEAVHIGSSEYDQKTYAIDFNKKGWVVLL
jgi:hypothetical protein